LEVKDGNRIPSGDWDENEKRERKEKKKQTQGFRECGEIGVGEGKGGDLCQSREPLGKRGGKGIARDFQGNGKRGF